jgi:hypothetical protein
MSKPWTWKTEDNCGGRMKRITTPLKEWHISAAKRIIENLKKYYADYGTLDGVIDDVAYDIQGEELKSNKEEE